MKVRLDKKHLLPGILAGVWLPLACWGLWTFAAGEFRPSAAGSPRAVWPADATLPRHDDGFTLVVALHPECPCSLATLEELDGILAQSRGRLRADVLCADYPDLPGPVADSRLWRRALRIADLSLSRDPDGAEARRFAARTSGEVRLYGPRGDLLFHGGITSGRGHVGPNPGATAVLDLVLGRPRAAAPESTPVFGCAL